MNALGRAQAEECGRRLAALAADPAGLDYVASPLGRTRDTMEILRDTLGLAPDAYRRDDRLAELGFGAWEGLSWREIRRGEPERSALRDRDRWTFVPPGGESYAALTLRVAPALAELGRDTVMVAHGGVARAILAMTAGMSREEAVHASIWQGRVLVIEAGRSRWA